VKDSARGLFNYGEINIRHVTDITHEQMDSIIPDHGLSRKEIEDYVYEGLLESMRN
jgi:hypothetical protein